MNRISVQSSNIVSVGYDKSSQTLEVEFKDYEVYRYYNVPESTYLNMINAVSVGKYLNEYIKDKYKFDKLT